MKKNQVQNYFNLKQSWIMGEDSYPPQQENYADRPNEYEGDKEAYWQRRKDKEAKINHGVESLRKNKAWSYLANLGSMLYGRVEKCCYNFFTRKDFPNGTESSLVEYNNSIQRYIEEIVKDIKKLSDACNEANQKFNADTEMWFWQIREISMRKCDMHIKQLQREFYEPNSNSATTRAKLNAAKSLRSAIINCSHS